MKRKDISQDIQSDLNKQYKTMLVLVKLVSALSLDVHRLESKVEEQNALINNLLAGDTLEEETV
jgi:archaellum component FlaC